MNIVIVASEVAPWSKTGGLGDVLGALPARLARESDVTVISPLYRGVRRAGLKVLPPAFDVPVGSTVQNARVYQARKSAPRLQHYFIGNDGYFDRDGLYGTSEGDFADNCERFVFLCRAAMELMVRLDLRPDIVHVHDWQAALIPAYLKTLYADRFPDARSVLTVHNLAYQGIFWHLDVPLTGLDWGLFNWKQLEFHGKMNLLKGGLIFADAITTVSPTYAREIRTPEVGAGLDGVLEERSGDLVGILNGIDVDAWNPADDKLIPAKFSAASMKGKAACKQRLQKASGFDPDPAIPVFGMVSRLAEQKGIDLVVQAMAELAALDIQIVVLGSGDAGYEKELERLATAHPGRLSVKIGFDDATSHLIQAGSDFLLMPSKYEPCGLSQMQALRYGTIPVVRKTGGLADTVRDDFTGLVFDDYSAAALVDAIRRAIALHGNPKKLAAMRKAGMAEDFSWEASAEKYLALFRGLRG